MPKILAFGGAGLASGGTINGNLVITGTLDVTGVATFTTTVTGSGNIMAGAAFAVGFTGRAQIRSSADAVLEFRNAANGANASGTFLNLTTTGLALFADGTAAAPSCAAASNTAIGLFKYNTGVLGIAGGSVVFQQNAGTINSVINALNYWAPSTGLITWASGAVQSLAFDVAIGKSAAGILALYGTSTANGSSLALASDKKVTFSSTTDPDGTKDFAIARQGAGVGQAEDGAGTLEDFKADYFWLVNEGTNGSDAATLLNGPAGTAGNPDKWLKVKGSDGTVYVIPAWTPT